jgi:DNA-binding NarL/FixJ family response regulator
VRIILAEDSALLREGLVGLLGDRGHDVVGRCGDAGELLELVQRHDPDLVVTDIRMPPTFTDEGARVAAEIRRTRPRIGILLLSQHIETRAAVDVVTSGAGVGYLLKDRVLDVNEFLEALDRVAAGGTVLDPVVVSALVRRAAPAADPLGGLSERERSVLELMADGRSNAAIAERLHLTERTVETHVGSLLGKLGIEVSAQDNRRVRAVLRYLDARSTTG